ncbi:hypothetical protein MLD38_035382 [Melastoma candidum]|uniref:Uncharacterized protein n=1 Tax=Melastoma candidum TaxID=119954 RepID=A0ACB9LGV8_9MYRT|nr:hypothetical protein MLD38_035382 [Melastoma candidum]
MATKSRLKPTRSQEEFIFHLEDDSDPQNPRSGETALAGFITLSGKKSMAVPCARSFKGNDAAASLPVNIPDWSRILQLGRREGYGYGYGYEEDRRDGGEEEEDEDENGKRVPPHVYLARRRGASFSVHEGVGRTLKGRDLRRVRNAIWEKVGFED